MNKRIFLILVLVVMSLWSVRAFAQDEPGTIPEVMMAQADLATLGGAAGLADPAALGALAGEGPFTLFAPNDEAFGVFQTENAELVSEILGDTELLTAILMYHIVPDDLTSEEILAALEESEEGVIELPTLLEGATLEVSLDEAGEMVLVNGVPVVEADVMASNGVIHKIGGLLVPPMEEELAPSYVMEIEAGAHGSEDDPLVVMLIPSENAEAVQTGATGIFDIVAEKTGIYMESIVATDYSAAIEAICNGEADIVALNTFGYILANQRECADVGLVSVRNGAPFYQGQIVTRADSGIESYADLAGKTFCRPDALSTSGWIVPSIALAANGIDIENDIELIDVGSHDAVITSVYNGDCDAGATFADARTRVQDELADVMEQVVVIELSAPIPNDTISFATEFDEEMRANLTDRKSVV